MEKHKKWDVCYNVAYFDGEEEYYFTNQRCIVRCKEEDITKTVLSSIDITNFDSIEIVSYTEVYEYESPFMALLNKDPKQD
jgi:hypothetical protein